MTMKLQAFAILMATLAFIAFQIQHQPKRYFPFCYVRASGFITPQNIGEFKLSKECLLNNGILTLSTSACLILISLLAGVLFARIPGTTVFMFLAWGGTLYALHYYHVWAISA